MQVVPIKCPNCGANVYVDDGINKCFCSNCGGQIIIDDGVSRSINVTIDKTKERELYLESERYRAAAKRLDDRLKRIKAMIFSAIPITALLFLVSQPFKNTSISGYIAVAFTFASLSFFITIPAYFATREKRDKLDQKDEKKSLININIGKKR